MPPETEQGDRHGNVRLLGELANEISGAGENDAVSGENHRTLRMLDQRNRVQAFLLGRREIGTVAG